MMKDTDSEFCSIEHPSTSPPSRSRSGSSPIKMITSTPSTPRKLSGSYSSKTESFLATKLTREIEDFLREIDPEFKDITTEILVAASQKVGEMKKLNHEEAIENDNKALKNKSYDQYLDLELPESDFKHNSSPFFKKESDIESDNENQCDEDVYSDDGVFTMDV